MKLFKRFIVIAVIAAFAVIAGNVSFDYSCDCGTVSFPFTLITKIFDTAAETPADETHKHETDGAASLLGGVAFAQQKGAKIKVTFIELGSVNCIPCRMMQPVMKQIEQKYGSQVKVVFHDVWTEKGAPYARTYGIRAIPTQVYLDSNGREFARHEGFHPFEEVEKILRKGGVR
ncbi:MAG: thioredoxin family protein [Spirochaetes bacterium]|nr:thioredoxin family protein [Spirochaetota bacterium]